MEKAMLIILDGYGFRKEDDNNAVNLADSPNLDRLIKDNPNTLLKCSGLDVGLPEGQMGNSEVGHLNIGSGRVVYQELSRISNAIDDGSFFENADFLGAVENVKKNGSALHIMGLLSNGGVHSSQKHYNALVRMAKNNGIEKLYVHCYLDGRDTPPQSALGYVKELEEVLKNEGVGEIATIGGRYFAMDRDNNFDRVKLAYDAICYGNGNCEESAVVAVEKSYEAGKNDEFMIPTVIMKNGEPVGLLNDKDSVIFFNFRPDRARQMTRLINNIEFTEFETKPLEHIFYVSMTQYDASFPSDKVHIAFKPSTLENTLGEYLASNDIAQLRIAETEKYAHVTYFFNGGNETPNKLEDRILVKSPSVETYDLKPEMSAYEVTDKLAEAIRTGKYGFIAVNYANCDMVGHTGILDAAIKAVEAVDKCVDIIVKEAVKQGYKILITADHGNAELMWEDGRPFTAHTTNDVVLIAIDDSLTKLENGRLCDIAPTILDLMGVSQPVEMTGKSLAVR